MNAARIAQGKRSAALGYRPIRIPSLLFPSGLARRGRAKPEGEKEKSGVAWVLPWAIIKLPRPGLRRPRAVRKRLFHSSRWANQAAPATDGSGPCAEAARRRPAAEAEP